MRGRGVGTILALATVVLGGAALGFAVLRSAAVDDRRDRPALAQALWPGHPAIRTDRALLAIGQAAARGHPAPPAVRREVPRIAASAPLNPEPFLIGGAIAQAEGRELAAERLLVAARDRDPRSRGARFLLAERYLRTGRIADGLIEMHSLVSLQSRGAEAFGPALVAYAATPGAVPQLRRFFRRYPHVEAGVLSVLAADAANADLVLALASNVRDPTPDWRGTLVAALASAGQFAKAQSVWSRLAGVRAGTGLFNPAFADLPAPPPFDWSFPQSGEGVAEPDGRGRLGILYYGRARVVLASQLLRLPPGNYRLAMAVERARGSKGALRWVLRCVPGQTVLKEILVEPESSAGDFAVPAGCEAQWLELTGVPGDVPETSELAITALRLVPGSAA